VGQTGSVLAVQARTQIAGQALSFRGVTLRDMGKGRAGEVEGAPRWGRSLAGARYRKGGSWRTGRRARAGSSARERARETGSE
jgi:hypothetical protein